MKRETRVNVSSFPVKLDLGCKDKTKEGFVGLDALDFGQSILWDINHGIPLPDNSVSEVYSSNFFEHLTEPEINLVVWEIKRVCIDGARVEIRVPPAESDVAYDIAHCTRWNEQRFRGLFNSTGDRIIEMTQEMMDLRAVITIRK